MNSFQILLNHIKNGESDDPKDIPPLDRIPTNEFLGQFLDDDEESESDTETANGDTSANEAGSTSSVNDQEKARAVARKASGKIRPARLAARDALREEDTETVLDVNESYPPYDDTGQTAYQNACKKFNSLPISSFQKKLGKSATIDISHYGAGPLGAKAIAIPMVINCQVTSLNLQGNGLKASGFAHIAKMMVENDFITYLNLADNNLKTEGAKMLTEMLELNHNIVELDLSGNGFTSRDAPGLFKAIEDHASLKILSLARNGFCELSAKALKSMIGESGSLNELDLSWNQIRGKAAIDVAKGLKENVGLKILDLSWNGFGDKGCKELANALKVCTLTELGLSNNRVTGEGILALCKTLKENDDLKILKLGKNPLPEVTVILALEFLKKLDELSLETLDLSDVLFSRSFQEKVDEVKAIHADFNCIHGYSDSYGKRKLRSYSVVGEAMNEMRKYCDEHNINIVELFARFDADGSMSVSHEEFKLGLREARIPLSDVQIDELIKTFDQDGDGEIDFSEMVMGAEKYKD